MYARVSIYGKLKPYALSIPREALIPAPGRDRVVVALGSGRFRVHEVLTGLESGSYVEILAGIDEGDEVVTSAQFLIDSEASLAGSVQRLEAAPGAAEERKLGPVFATGRVEQIDAAKRQVRIEHGPIEALGWPSMNMVFDARATADLSQIRVGQNVRFSLEQEHAGHYVLARIFPDQNGAGEMSEVQPGQFADESEPGAKPEKPAERRVMAAGTIRKVMQSEHKLRLEHDPIPELDWPSMTMNFRVREAVAIDQLEAGQAIHFVMVKDGDAWVIDQVHVMDSGTDAGEHHHD